MDAWGAIYFIAADLFEVVFFEEPFFSGMTSSSPGANWLWVHLPPQLTVDQCADFFPDVDAKPYRGSGRREVFAPVHSLYRRISLVVFGGCGPPAQST